MSELADRDRGDQPRADRRREVGLLVEAVRVWCRVDVVPKGCRTNGLTSGIDGDATVLLPGDRQTAHRQLVSHRGSHRDEKRLPPVVRILGVLARVWCAPFTQDVARLQIDGQHLRRLRARIDAEYHFPRHASLLSGEGPVPSPKLVYPADQVHPGVVRPFGVIRFQPRGRPCTSSTATSTSTIRRARWRRTAICPGDCRWRNSTGRTTRTCRSPASHPTYGSTRPFPGCTPTARSS